LFDRRVAVITPSLPDRGDLLAVCVASVNAQTVPPFAHVIRIDHGRIGPAETRNGLALSVPDVEWYMPLDDDDVLYPDHIETLLKYHSVADVIYSWPDTDGVFDEVFHRPYEEAVSIPVTALVRSSVWWEVGGFRPVEEEDSDLWGRAKAAGARFHCVDRVTWRYRIHERSLYSSP
jgi:hypothetical protein